VKITSKNCWIMMIMDDNDDNPQKDINGSRIPYITFVTFATIKRGFEHYSTCLGQLSPAP
jgi:hypothetical protein